MEILSKDVGVAYTSGRLTRASTVCINIISSYSRDFRFAFCWTEFLLSPTQTEFTLMQSTQYNSCSIGLSQ